MTEIDFYILEQESDQERLRYACRLTEKGYQLGHRVYLHCADAASAELLGRLLWSFRAGSFVPHDPAGSEPETPVHVGYDFEPREGCELLINLSDSVPPFFARFERLMEVVGAAGKAAGRERFRFYKERGYTLRHHVIGG